MITLKLQLADDKSLLSGSSETPMIRKLAVVVDCVSVNSVLETKCGVTPAETVKSAFVKRLIVELRQLLPIVFHKLEKDRQ